MSWYLFLLLLDKVECLEARAMLRIMDATTYSAAMVNSEHTGRLDAYRAGLLRIARRDNAEG